MKSKEIEPAAGSNSNRPMLKMRELAEATGVKKPTILFYINEGLLPKPVKTSPNVSFYPHSFIERINLIRTLQSKHRLSLVRIKEILAERDNGKEIAPLIELNEVVFGSNDPVQLDLDSFCQKTGLNTEQVEQATANELLIPQRPDSFDSEDLAMGNVLKQCFEFGLSFENVTFYTKMGKEIVKEEMSIHKQLLKEEPFEKAVTTTLELTRIARTMRGYVIDRLFQKDARRKNQCQQADAQQS